MSGPPEALAFDVIGTLFSLETLRPRLVAAGLPAHALEPWVAGALRDLFALGATGRTATMRAVLDGSLQVLLAAAGIAPDEAVVAPVLVGMTALDPRPGAESALRALRNRGLRLMALSNGALAATRSLLDRAGFAAMFDEVVSIDEVGQPKPCGAVYRYAAERLGLAPARLALVSAHPWDLAGAAAAGLAGVHVSLGLPFPAALGRADASTPDFTGLPAALDRLG